MAIRARWKGDPTDPTAHLSGIPGRDIAEDDPDDAVDWKRLSKEDRERVRDSGLYEVRTDAQMRPPAAAKPKRDRSRPAETATAGTEPAPAEQGEPEATTETEGGPD